MTFRLPAMGEIPDFAGIRVKHLGQVLVGDTSPKSLGTIEGGEGIVILGSIAVVSTVWNGTTPTVEVGVNGDADAYIDTADYNEAALGVTVKFASANPSGDMHPASDQALIATITKTDTTTGVVDFYLIYAKLDEANPSE